MTYKYHLRSLVLACLMGGQSSSGLYAVETHYYEVKINDSIRRATVSISAPAIFDNSVTVTTHIEGMDTFTYSYCPLSDSPTGYLLTVIEPPSHNRYSVAVNGIAANYNENQYDYPDDLYFWPEDSPAVISLDGHSLQLPIFTILLTDPQPSGNGSSVIFRGYHFSTPDPVGPLTQVTTDSNFSLIEIHSTNYRMIKSLPHPESDKSDTESESSLYSDSEDSLPDLFRLRLKEFKENRKDKDDDPDPEGSCSSGHFIQATH